MEMEMLVQHQILGGLLALSILVSVVGFSFWISTWRQIYRESRESAEAAREAKELTGATLEVARQILHDIRQKQ